MSNILGVSFSKRTMGETVDLLMKKIDSNSKKAWHVVTANPEMVMIAQKNEKFFNILQESELITADGIGIVVASKMFNDPVSERVPGFDLTVNLIKEREQQAKITTVYMLGADSDTLKLAIKNLEDTYTHIRIKGYHNGFFKPEDEDKIIQEINECEPDLLLVAMGCPRQELFISKYKTVLKAKVAIGVGGTFDVLSGKVKRAPALFQKLYLEWFYRLLSNPKRLGRQFSLVQFIFAVRKEKRNLKKRNK